MMPVTVILFNGQKRSPSQSARFFLRRFRCIEMTIAATGHYIKNSSVHRSVDIFEVQFKTGWIRSCVHNNVKNAYLSLRIENKITCVKHRHGLRTSSTSGTTPTVINFQYIFFASSLPQMKWNILSVNNSYSLGLFSLSLSFPNDTAYAVTHCTHAHTLMMADWLNTKRQNGRRWTNMYKMKSHRLKKHQHPHKLNVVYDYFFAFCTFVSLCVSKNSYIIYGERAFGKSTTCEAYKCESEWIGEWQWMRDRGRERGMENKKTDYCV